MRRCAELQVSVTLRLAAVAILAAAFLVPPLWPVGEAQAARFHVRTGGLLTSGPSLSGVWSLENCYPTLALAAQNAAAADSLLLFRETHELTAPVALPSLLANQDLDSLRADCRLHLSVGAGLSFKATVTHGIIRGFTFVGAGATTTVPALRVGGASAVPADVEVRDCEFTGFLMGTAGGGGSCLQVAGGGTGSHLIVSGCSFADNAACNWGGAIFLGDGVTAAFEGSTFHGNRCLAGGNTGGGAVTVASGVVPSSLHLTDCTLDSNLCVGPGGAIDAEDASLALTNCDVTRNRSAEGGLSSWSAGAGVFMRRMPTHQAPISLTISDCRITGNIGNLAAGLGAGDGGGVLVKGNDTTRMVDVQVSGTLFADNFNDQGAGLYFGRFATGTVERCTFRGNIAFRNGGGSYKGGSAPENIGETATFIYCDFSDNRAGYYLQGVPHTIGGSGGGFATRLYPRADFYNCTFSNNLCGTTAGSIGDAFDHTAEGSLFADPRQACSMTNCVFWGATGNDFQLRSDTNGLRPVTACAFALGQLWAGGSSPTLIRLLTTSPFVSDSDPHLLAGSECVDTGVPLAYATDIEGNPVPRGAAADIGAYESPWTTGGTAVADPTPDVAGRTLTASPNPFNPRTVLGFEVERPGHVRLAIYDLHGRLVATLVNERLEAGRHVVTWQGRDARGRAVASGAYAAVLQCDGRRLRTPLTLLR